MRKFWFVFGIAVMAACPAVYFRFQGTDALSPGVRASIFGIALLAAGFMLSWGLESAEEKVTRGLAIAVLALVTVLPEYAIDVFFAFRAGQHPGSNYAQLAAANMTGANRLLIGVAWPLLLFIYWVRTRGRERTIVLAPNNLTELAYLTVASLYGFVIVFKARIDLYDAVALGTIFLLYLRRAAQRTATSEEREEEPEIGPGAALEQLAPVPRWSLVGLLAFLAISLIILVAEPFAESLVATGRTYGISEFLLVQWIAPIASESPEVILCFVFAIMLRPTIGLGALISDKINQWTLLVGILPVAVSVGAGGLHPLVLGPRQHEEFFLTAAQSVFAVALLLKLKFTHIAALVLFSLFIVQIAFAIHYQHREIEGIRHLTFLAWGYLALSVILLVADRGHGVRQLIREGLLVKV